VLRTAQADILPLRYGDFAETVAQYVEELHKLTDDLRERTDRQNRLLAENAFKLASDPTETELPPERESPVPFLNFAPLDNALIRLRKSAKASDEACARAVQSDSEAGHVQRVRLNNLLQGVEQTLLHPLGLPNRSWYCHMIYAPGLHTGYGVKTLPGVREAIEQRRWQEAEQYIGIVAAVLDVCSGRLDGARLSKP
jgi:N-acetylated-alpha-linked acidic dipeptidase